MLAEAKIGHRAPQELELQMVVSSHVCAGRQRFLTGAMRIGVGAARINIRRNQRSVGVILTRAAKGNSPQLSWLAEASLEEPWLGVLPGVGNRL